MKYLVGFICLLISASALSAEKSEFEHAIESNDTEKIQALISNGQDVNQKYGGLQQPAISLALGFNERLEALTLLLENGAKVNAVDRYNSTAINKAAALGSYEAVKILLDYGADPNHVDSDGSFPLYSAVSSNNRDKVKLLLDRGADVNLTTGELTFGYSALISAVIKNDAEMAGMLLKHGADITYKSPDGDALSIAKQMKFSDLVTILESYKN